MAPTIGHPSLSAATGPALRREDQTRESGKDSTLDSRSPWLALKATVEANGTDFILKMLGCETSRDDLVFEA
ncbi:hypothetical protein N7519_000908 [Penicillium mononematosum]|uniref:uncharacterized protein n=1 Tax=Penicillium mononematosum TaxID=268346 RepID=UPI00254868FF|nr:uncharacterized protein N7519_000908 [Penicillium mononematosum]KAJ6190887.1 hypothetical protein N7519_000908 [Penicillium mononematosum]